MDNSKVIEQLNAAKYIYLRELSEPRDNSLKLVVEEAVANGFGVVDVPNVPELSPIFKGAHPIESVPGCKKFELYWAQYVAYLVTEEIAGSTGDYHNERYVGRLFRHYSKSQLPGSHSTGHRGSLQGRSALQDNVS